MSSDDVSALLVKLKSPDLDVKVDALTKLQNAFAVDPEPRNVDALTAALSPCLRNSNALVLTPTISLIRTLIREIDARDSQNPRDALAASTSSLNARQSPDLRHTFQAFLPAGGIIDKLGDHREPIRTLARDALVEIGTVALKHGVTGGSALRKGDRPETLYAQYEKNVKEVGFGSKVWRVREQILKVVVELRRSSTAMPLRSYTSSFVDSLEDSDPNVRECARESTITLFSSPGISDAARADLKEQVAKKGVRKTIADQIMMGLMSSTSSAASSNGDPSEGERPPPRAPSRLLSSSRGLSRTVSQPRPETPSGAEPSQPVASGSTDVPVVYIASARDLEHEFVKMLPHFEGRESEENWLLREGDIVRIRGMLRGANSVPSRYLDTFIHGLRNGILESSFRALTSLRTTLSTHAILLYTELAETMGPNLDPFTETLVTQLLKLASLTKRIIANLSQAALRSIIEHTTCPSKMLVPHLLAACTDKNAQVREATATHTAEFLRAHGETSRAAIERDGLESIEKIIQKGLSDAHPGTKVKARECFWAFQAVWPTNAQRLAAALSSPALKELNKAMPSDAPTTSLGGVIAPTPVKKPNTSAMIRAAKEKARQNAAAPPTLRHAATSGASAANRLGGVNVSPSATMSRSSTSPQLNGASAVPTNSSSRLSLSRASPPPSPRASGIAVASRSVSASATNTLRGHAPSSFRAQSPTLSPPASPTDALTRRRLSSPLTSSEPKTPKAHHSPSTSSHFAKTITPPNFGKSHSRNDSGKSISSLRRLQESEKITVPRESLDLYGANGNESLLMAMENPLPPDSSSDEEAFGLTPIDTTMRRIPSTPSRSSPTNAMNPQSPPRSTHSSLRTLFPGDSVSQNGGATPSQAHPSIILPAPLSPLGAGPQDLVIEDALRADAEQAVSSAERLTEMMEPEHSHLSTSTTHTPSVLITPLRSLNLNVANDSAGSSLSGGSSSIAKTTVPDAPPVTPLNSHKSKGLLAGLSLFQNSPAVKASPSVMDRLYENKATSGWWLKRKSLLDAGTPLKAKTPESLEDELLQHITALQDGTASIRTLQKLVLICNANPAIDSDEPPESPLATRHNSLSPSTAVGVDIWDGGRAYDTLVTALLAFLRGSTDEEVLEYGLCVIWEMVEHQTMWIDENEIFSFLFFVRYTNTHPILEATSTIRDNIVGRQDPVWCLKTLHACLLAYLAQPSPPPGRQDLDERVLAQIRASTQAFGLIGLGKLIMRLPPEILEEELPLMKSTLVTVLDERDPLRTTVREAAYATIVAAQAILRDEIRLFALFGGLDNSKKNLLTYYFDKHGARGAVEGVKIPGTAAPGHELGEEDVKVVKELIRLDAKISTPVKSR